MFQLTKGEWTILKSQIVTSNSTDNQEDDILTSQIVFLISGQGASAEAKTQNRVYTR